MEINRGDLIILGKHRLLCGDCTKPENIKKLMGQEKITSIIVDVPYGIEAVQSKEYLKSGIKNKIIANDQHQSEEDYACFMRNWLSAIKPYLEIPNSYYIFNSDKMLFALKDALDAEKFYFSQLIVWIKNHAIIGRLDYLPQHEIICYGWFGKHKFRKSKDKSVQYFPKPNKSELHATMKPVGLIRNLILNSTEIGDIVYDGFLGSGTTIIAAEHTKRRCFGAEIDLEHCKTIIKRYKKLTGIDARKEQYEEK